MLCFLDFVPAFTGHVERLIQSYDDEISSDGEALCAFFDYRRIEAFTS